ncbi:MAG: hypothetical protein R3F11_13020 [Verrucomicrobiales bacterium]
MQKIQRRILPLERLDGGGQRHVGEIDIRQVKAVELRLHEAAALGDLRGDLRCRRR